ncbi:MAG: ATP-dependent Clp protease ATP-binding subunit, partial [Planctomycetes bacterium]|nr:ATP-dependent Clp protease ATP-binding subunit [Planctomycetota bacterium]
RLTDSLGRHIDFRNTVLIMTSNIGSELIKGKGEFGLSKQGDIQLDYKKMQETLRKEMENHFRPEFINRLDEVIVFKPLEKSDLDPILEIELASVQERLRKRGMELILTPEARTLLIEKGYHHDFGARPLRREIEHRLEDPLSEKILRGEMKDSARILVRVEGEELVFVPAADTEAVGAGGKT